MNVEFKMNVLKCERRELTAGYFCSTKDAKEKGAFGGYKVTNMASHAASLVYTLNAWSSQFPTSASIKRSLETKVKSSKTVKLTPRTR